MVAPRQFKLLRLIRELSIVTKDRSVVRFGDVMNYAQLDLIRECERQLNETGHIRMVVLKARQMGLSTAIEAVLFSLGFLVDRNQALIVSHELPSSQHILTMCATYWSTFPWRRHFTTRYAGRKELSWVETGSSVKVATAGSDDVGRSQTITCLHASEVAFWSHPDELMNGLRQAIPNEGTTAIFIESTANGVGNWFHRTWREAASGRSEMAPRFYPWWRHPEYTAEHLRPGQAEMYGLTEHSLTPEERELRGMGVDDARLVWRRWAIVNLSGGNLDLFKQEYPATSSEAFLTTGRNVFPLKLLLAHYKPMHGEYGRLAVLGGQIRFVPCGEFEGGALRVFVRPTDDPDWGRYIIGADPTHTDKGDYACAQVLNRRTLEQVAVYRRRCDPVQFAQDLVLLSRHYNDALVVAEKQGPGYATVGALAAANVNQWVQEKVDNVKGTGMGKYGWSTNAQSKHYAIQTLLHELVLEMAHAGDRQLGLLIHDDVTGEEMRQYVSSPKGNGYENGDGTDHDDTVMALAIAVTVNRLEPLPPFGDAGPGRMRLVNGEDGPRVESLDDPPSWDAWGEGTGTE